MRTLLLIACFLGLVSHVAAQDYAQAPHILPETVAIINAMSTKPTGQRLWLINRTVGALKDAGVWQRLESLQIYAAETQSAATVDWVSPTRVVNPVNSPTFTADRGFAGDGSTSYINTGFTSLGSTKFTSTTSLLGARVNSDPTIVANVYIAGNTRWILNPRQTGSNAQIQSANSGANLVAVSNSLRLILSNRSSTTGYDVYQSVAGVTSFVTSVTQAGGATQTDTFYVCARNSGASASGFTSRQVSAFFVGGALTSDQVIALGNALEAYMKAIGNTG